MNKKTGLILFLLIGVGLVGWGLKKYYFTQTNRALSEAVLVQTAIAQTASLPIEAKAIGTLVAAQQVAITPEIPGHVEHIYFQDGAFVKKGMVLIQLDDAIYKAKHQSAIAQLKYSENNYKRAVILGKQGAIAKQAIDQAEAELKEKMANAQESEVMVNKMKLIAPFDGMVGKSAVHLGDYVTVTNSVVMLTDIAHLRMEYHVPEKYLPLLKRGQEVKISTAAYPGQFFYGKVAFISPTISSENRSVALYADIPNETQMLTAGMLVEVTHFLGIEQKAVMIPARSLVPVLDGEHVYTIVDGKAFAKPVTIGKRLKDKVQILDGLSSDTVVITDGQLKLKNGMPVKMQPQAATVS